MFYAEVYGCNSLRRGVPLEVSCGLHSAGTAELGFFPPLLNHGTMLITHSEKIGKYLVVSMLHDRSMCMLGGDIEHRCSLSFACF